MLHILQTQKKHIIAHIAKHADDSSDRQRRLFAELTEDELRQLKANQKHWHVRLERLERERLEEPDRIREVYDVKAQRIEPVGLVYLWPVTG